MATLQGWAQATQYLHTYVYCPDVNAYFQCWGTPPNYTNQGNRLVCSGNGNYNRANCYRDPVLGYPDTAGIGIYGVNGVCHQSANCFLLSANTSLNPLLVPSYWLTLCWYGVLGTNSIWWLGAVYGICSWFNPSLAPEMPTEIAAESSVVDKIRSLYASHSAQANPPDPHERLIDEAATVTQHYAPEADPSKYRDLHAESLNEKDALIATGITGQALADKLNSLSGQFQVALAQRVGAELYKKLSGVDAGQTVDIIEPGLAAAAGLPVPPFKHG